MMKSICKKNFIEIFAVIAETLASNIAEKNDNLANYLSGRKDPFYLGTNRLKVALNFRTLRQIRSH